MAMIPRYGRIRSSRCRSSIRSCKPIQWRGEFAETVASRLLTPFGLRSLAPGEPNYKATYDGDLRARDAAYHQGTVWAWLIGPLIDAWLRVHPHDVEKARDLLAGFGPHLTEACVGSISGALGAEARPIIPRGCVLLSLERRRRGAALFGEDVGRGG